MLVVDSSICSSSLATLPEMHRSSMSSGLRCAIWKPRGAENAAWCMEAFQESAQSES